MKTSTAYVPFKDWAALPTSDVPPFAVELVGDFAMGKTHFSGTFPSPALCDTELKGGVVWKKFLNNKYFQAKDWGEVLAFTDHCLLDPNVETLVFDSSKDIRDYAEAWTLGEIGKKSLVSNQGGKVIAVNYSLVYCKLDSLVHRCRVAGKNILFTTRVKPKYVNNEKTQEVERDGYNKAPYQFDIVLHLKPGIQNEVGKTLFKRHIFGHVVKLGWNHYTSWPPCLINCSYQGIVDELYHDKGWGPEKGGLDQFIDQVVGPEMARRGVVP